MSSMRNLISLVDTLFEGVRDSPQFIQTSHEFSGQPPQGNHPDHDQHPYHALLKSHQYRYSHTTPIRTRDGWRSHHTYSHLDLPDNRVSVSDGTWEAGKGGSRRRTSGKTPAELDKFLRSHVRRSVKAQTRDDLS